MIDEKVPIFVCKCCGNIIRAIGYEESDIYNCRICGAEMFKTIYSMNDNEYNEIFSDSKRIFDFKSDVFSEYVQGNELYSNKMHKKRLDEEAKRFNEWMYGTSVILP